MKKVGMNERGEVENPIISGHLFLNEGDKKTAKSDLQKKISRKGVRGSENKKQKENNRDKQPRD